MSDKILIGIAFAGGLVFMTGVILGLACLVGYYIHRLPAFESCWRVCCVVAIIGMVMMSPAGQARDGTATAAGVVVLTIVCLMYLRENAIDGLEGGDA